MTEPIVEERERRSLRPERRRPWKTREWGMMALVAACVVMTSAVLLATTGGPVFVWLAGIATLAFLFFVLEIWLSPK